MDDKTLVSVQTLITDKPAVADQIKQAKSVREFIEICNANGIQMTQAELMRSQAERILKFSDAELESAHINAAFYSTDTIAGCVTWALTCTCSANPC
jgi:hypothetical protein